MDLKNRSMKWVRLKLFIEIWKKLGCRSQDAYKIIILLIQFLVRQWQLKIA